MLQQLHILVNKVFLSSNTISVHICLSWIWDYICKILMYCLINIYRIYWLERVSFYLFEGKRNPARKGRMLIWDPKIRYWFDMRSRKCLWRKYYPIKKDSLCKIKKRWTYCHIKCTSTIWLTGPFPPTTLILKSWA